jgi:protein-L-isoaspartate(D-aspartate) O-methyltransferase
MALWAFMSVEAGDLRARMVDDLQAAGTVRTSAVDKAMRQIPRHLFLPDVDLRTAYRDDAVMTKHATDGSPISSVSQPTIVAIMLEQLDIQPGQQVLEVGTGSGYNAALLAVITGATGHVVTIELEHDLAESARQRILGLGLSNVEVVVGDGRDGCAAQAPYHRVIITAGAQQVALAWTDELAEEGKLVAPLVDQAGVGTIVVFQKTKGAMVRKGDTPCGFLPLRQQPASTGSSGCTPLAG